MRVKTVFSVICVVILILICGCKSVSDGFDALTTNTTVDEAMTDLADINVAIAEANKMLQNKDTSVYGNLVHTDTISFKDVISKKELDEQAATKRIDGVSYYLYWDNNTKYPFWSTDGTDDIRNSQENFNDITHDNSTRIKNKTNISQLK